MHLLSAQKLSKRYGDTLLFANASFSISNSDRIGLVGVNGSGKSTLLKILAGLEPPDAGKVVRNPKARIEYLPQNPPMDEEVAVLDYLFQGQSPTMQLLRRYQGAVRALSNAPHNPNLQSQLDALHRQMDAENGWAAESNAKAILTRLGVSNFNAPLGQLSGGQRRRAALARALLYPADLLILDEPTNHIDPETIAWLENYLGKLKSALLMVTHDRYLLDRIANQILEIDSEGLHIHRGNYSVFLKNKTQRESLNQKLEAERHNILRRELNWLHRSPMARGGKQKARIQRADALLKTQVAAPAASLKIAAASRRSGKQILELRNVSKSFGGKTLINSFSYNVKKGDRLGVVGPNGAGKSTLLNLIAKRLQPDAGEIVVGATIHTGYFDQEGEALDENQRILNNVTDIAAVVRAANGERITAAQMLVRFQFPRKTHRNYISTLSGGERRRLSLLRTLMMAPNLLLLDEPTNDLDIQTLSVLEDYLETFQGVLVVVSHDRYFLDRTVEHIFAFEGDGQISRYPGNYSVYQTKKAQRQAQQAPPKPTRIKSPRSSSPQNTPRRLSYKEKQELIHLEARISDLETQKKNLAEEINLTGSNYQKLQTLSAAFNRLESELDAAIERWTELAELAE